MNFLVCNDVALLSILLFNSVVEVSMVCIQLQSGEGEGGVGGSGEQSPGEQIVTAAVHSLIKLSL